MEDVRARSKPRKPTAKQFLDRKTFYLGKHEPVWEYLEREMLANVAKKPYNQKVGDWLRFLKDMKYYFFCEEKRKRRRLKREVGPKWFTELSDCQRRVLEQLGHDIHEDLVEDLPRRMRRALHDLGITLKLSNSMLMAAATNSVEDPGIFIWNLFASIYKHSPSIKRTSYDINGILLMSSIVFIDMEECVDSLEKLTAEPKSSPPPPEKKKKPPPVPDVRFGEYLQKFEVNMYVPKSLTPRRKRTVPELSHKIKLRSKESYERLCLDDSFIEKRKRRSLLRRTPDRKCTYKFWEAPASLRTSDPAMRDYLLKLKMLKKRPRRRHKREGDNAQYNVAGVGFTGGTPHFVLNPVCILTTGYIPIRGGGVMINGKCIVHIIGHWAYPKVTQESCTKTCKCSAKWDEAVMKFLKESKCKCGHYYDFYHEGKAKEKYFMKPTRNRHMWFDEARIFEIDSTESFIKKTVNEALKSAASTPTGSTPHISAAGLSERELLASFLAELSDTALIIPHLPEADKLNSLQAWVRRRVKGEIKPEHHKRMLLESQRRWLDLKHFDFRARAYIIPFTLKEIKEIDWSDRKKLGYMYKVLFDSFKMRNALLLLEQTRYWWSTTKYDLYPGKPFLDLFFTYMPSRTRDVYLIHPYDSERTPKYGAKTCNL